MDDRLGAGRDAGNTGTPFVGRASQRERLAAQVDGVRSGVPAIVLVEGPAGIGKTALVRRVLRDIPDFRVVAATGEEWEFRLAGGVVAQLMSDASGRTQLEELRSVEPPADPVHTGVRLLDLLAQLQEQGPVAVVVDDAQWADGLSVQALAFTLRRLQRDHVMAIFVTRDDPPLPEALRRLGRSAGGTTLRLEGLDPSELAELSYATIGRTLSGRAAERLCAHTGGNPLHARALLEELGADVLEAGEGLLPAPTSFAMVIAARLVACPPETVNLVQAAAVLGGRCSLGTASVVGGVADAAQALDYAVTADLLCLCPQREIAFVHPLVRAAVYSDLRPSRRAALHAKAAEALDGPAALFHRVEAALVEDPVLASDVEAYARQELARGSVTSGADALLAAARLVVDGPRRSALVLDAVEVLLSGGDVARAAAVAKEVTDGADPARHRYLLGHLALFSGCQKEAEVLLSEAWSACERSGGRLKALVATGLAQVCSMQLRSAEAAEWARRAIDASVDPELTTSALSVLVPCLGRIGRPTEALAATASATEDDRTTASVHIEGLLGRGIVRLWVDDLEQAREDLTAVLAACRHRPASRPALVALGMLADTEYRLGAWDDSVAHAAQVVSLVEDSEQVWVGAFAHAAATWVLAPRGDFARAEAHARSAADAGRVMGDATSVGCAATAAAHVAFFRGDMAGAVVAVQPMLELGVRADADEPSIHRWRELHVEALLRLGRFGEAETALEVLDKLATSRDRRSSLAHAVRLRAELAAIRGLDDMARAGFQAAVEAVRPLGTPFDHARTQEAYGRYLRRRGERRAAADQLQAARKTYMILRASPLVLQCEQELAACGLEPCLRSEPRARELTPQELAVARLVVSGRTNREVAAELIVSPKTVEYHLGHVYAKLGVRSRTQLAARLATTDAFPTKGDSADPEGARD